MTVTEERFMLALARNAGGLWIAVGTVAGTAIGLVAGFASLGLAAGLVVGLLGGAIARR